MKENRPFRAAGRLVAAVAPCLLAGCGMFSAAEHTDFAMLVTAPAEVVAWGTSALVVERWPCADPMPVRGSVPVLRQGEDQFTIELGLSAGTAVIASNGRLDRPHHRLQDGVRTRLEAPEFRASATTTRAEGSDGFLSCTITREPSATRLEFHLGGDACDRDLVERVKNLCAMFDAMRQIDAAFADRDAGLAAARSNQILCGLRASNGTVPELEAPLWSALAAARIQLGDVALARAAATSARDAAGHEAIYALLLARVDERLARFPGVNERADVGMMTLVDVSADPRLRLAARAKIAERDRQGEIHPSIDTIAQRAAQLLAAGDVVGADAWATRLRTRHVDLHPIQDNERARVLGHHREAFVHALESLTRGRFDADVLAHLVDDAIACGDPIAGLRVMSRHWRDLEQVDPGRGTVLARRLIIAIGSGTAARVAVSENCDALALLALGDSADPRTRADIAAVRRLDSLRRQVEGSVGADALATPVR